MTETIHNYFTTDTLGATSKQMFNIALDRWKSCWGMPKTLEWIIQHPALALECLAKAEHIKNTPANHHRFISAVVAYLKHEAKDRQGAYDTWKQVQAKNALPLKERYLTGEPTDLQKDKIQAWERILKVRDELELNETKLLMAVYTYLNPLRADFYDCIIYHDKSEIDADVGVHNYVILDDAPRLVLGDYKTKKTHGTLTLDMPNELVELLARFLDEHPHRVWLFEQSVDTGTPQPFTRKTFSQWANRKLSRAFHAPMTLTALRHAFAGQLDFNRPICELHDIAKSMGHTIAVQRVYKWDEAR